MIFVLIMFVFVCAACEYIFYSKATLIIYAIYPAVNIFYQNFTCYFYHVMLKNEAYFFELKMQNDVTFCIK